MLYKREDFPDPIFPTTHTNSPDFISKLIFFITGCAEVGELF